MSCLIFFPWLEVKGRTELGSLALVPYERGSAPFGPGNKEQDACDGVLAPYHDGSHPIRKATLLEHDGGMFGAVSQEATGDFFVFRDVVACAALSEREFFGHGFPYWNFAYFEMIIQSFDDPHGSVPVTTRRRDGRTTHHMTRDVYSIRRPFHVTPAIGMKIDVDLASALLTAKDKSSIWHEYYDAIYNFNQANTDSNETSEAQEAVMLIGAFQRALCCAGSSEDELSGRIMTVFKPYIHVDIQTSEKIKNFKHYTVKALTLMEAWVHDFYQLRGENAHGKRLPRRPLVWASTEHLLLAAYLFPLILKLRLQQDGFYKLTDDDEADLTAFEPLLESKCLEQTPDGKSWV